MDRTSRNTHPAGWTSSLRKSSHEATNQGRELTKWSATCFVGSAEKQVQSNRRGKIRIASASKYSENFKQRVALEVVEEFHAISEMARSYDLAAQTAGSRVNKRRTRHLDPFDVSPPEGVAFRIPRAAGQRYARNPKTP